MKRERREREKKRHRKTEREKGLRMRGDKYSIEIYKGGKGECVAEIEKERERE